MRSDAITRDIRAAVRAGHFDRRRRAGPTELETTPARELLERVAMMSDGERCAYLASIGQIRRGKVWLSDHPVGQGRQRPPSLLGGELGVQDRAEGPTVRSLVR